MFLLDIRDPRPQVVPAELLPWYRSRQVEHLSVEVKGGDWQADRHKPAHRNSSSTRRSSFLLLIPSSHCSVSRSSFLKQRYLEIFGLPRCPHIKHGLRLICMSPTHLSRGTRQQAALSAPSAGIFGFDRRPRTKCCKTPRCIIG